MYNLYIIAPNYSFLLSQIFDEFRNSDNERLFKTMGVSDNLFALTKLIEAKDKFNSNIVLVIKPELTKEEHELILKLSILFKTKTFIVILLESSSKLEGANLTTNNLKYITSLKLSQPKLMNKLIHEIIPHIESTQISADTQSKKNLLTKKSKSKKRRYMNWDSGVISVIGVSHGVGVTHTCIILANYLKEKKKVAVIESNDHKHFMEIFHHKMKRNEFQKDVYNNVHYFWNIDLVQFWTHFRHDYDYVIIDTGVYEDLYDLDVFLRSDKKIILTHGVDWKLKELYQFYPLSLKYDPKNQWIYCIPFLERKYIKDIDHIINNKIFTIPFQMDPFKPSKDVCEVLKDILR
ncbi:hypothetical protein [Vallitalea okinawensis]|uniref:hypothetical protein n=1 Tax=Vallitalea okinawensis TaxID=2078660 RepID=UPI000CFAB38A|nr:hypothetical protein [Vallitalea okinawensis]